MTLYMYINIYTHFSKIAQTHRYIIHNCMHGHHIMGTMDVYNIYSTIIRVKTTKAALLCTCSKNVTSFSYESDLSCVSIDFLLI